MKKSSLNSYVGTKTEKNLMDAFEGESQARNQYTYFTNMHNRKDMTSYHSFFENGNK